MKTINSKSTKADILTAYKELQATVLTLQKELAKQPIQVTTYVDQEAHIKAANNRTTATYDARYKAQEDAKHGTTQDATQKTRTKPDPKTLPPTAAQLNSIINTVTYNNLHLGFILPLEFTKAAYTKFLEVFFRIPKTVRPGKPIKPDLKAPMDIWDTYYADCKTFYRRQTLALKRLCEKYPDHKDYIKAQCKK